MMIDVVTEDAEVNEINPVVANNRFGVAVAVDTVGVVTNAVMFQDRVGNGDDVLPQQQTSVPSYRWY